MSYAQQATANACDSAAIEKKVQITSHGGQVDQTTVNVNKNNGDEITWFSSGTRALVVFASPDGSPFEEGIFHVPAGGSVSTGAVKETAESKGYKYSVVGQTGVNDPVVIVET